LPDTQFYSESHPDIFNEQTQWIVNNQKNYNIQFVLGEGDIVNTAEQPGQWQNANGAIKLLDNANIPYVMAIGNHDYGDEDPSTRDTSAYNSYFGPSRYASYNWYMGGYPSGTDDNFYAEFTVNGKQYLVLALEFVPQDATLAWAKTVLDANPDKEIIVLAHSFTFTDSTRADQCDNDDMPAAGNNQGEDVWQKLLIYYPNLSLVLNGHSFIGNNAARRVDLGLQHNLVNEILSDYQNLANGGDGWMRIMSFRPNLNRIDVTSYSPYLNQYLTDPSDQFSITWHSTGVTAGTGTVVGEVFGGSAAPAPYACVPIVGANVTASGVSASATTNSTGAFSLSLPSGNYTLSATAPGWSTTASDQEAAYPGYTGEAKFFLSPQLGAVSGTVTNASGSPLSGAALAFSGGTLTTQITVTTDTTGSFSSPSISVGRYTVTASAQGMTTSTASTTVAQGATTTLNIQLSASSGETCTGGAVNRTVTICSPANNASVTSPVSIVAQANDAAAVANTQIYIDGTKKYQIAGSSVNNSLPLTAGTHRVVVLAVDSAGTFKNTVYVTATATGGTGGGCSAPTSPGVQICQPVNGATVSSPVAIQATTTVTGTIARMEVWIDGAKKYSESSSTTLNTNLTLAAGTHRFAVLAFNAAGNKWEQAYNATVK
ncbi:MAG: carboxypeptidase regulatory-like domain-containing protein, partial [Acidobacteriota bacterium]